MIVTLASALILVIALNVVTLYLIYRIHGILKLKLTYLRALADNQQDTTREMSAKIQEMDKNLSLAGKVLGYIEQETQILHKRKEQAEQLQKRFRSTPR